MLSKPQVLPHHLHQQKSCIYPRNHYLLHFIMSLYKLYTAWEQHHLTLLTQLHNTSLGNCTNIFSHFQTQGHYYEQIIILCALNSIPTPFANTQPTLQQDQQVVSTSHALLLKTFKPIQITGDGSCMYDALSVTLTGAEKWTQVLRLLTAYALVKCEHQTLDALANAFPRLSHDQIRAMLTQSLLAALDLQEWGTDYQLFAIALAFNRPIFQYNTFYETCGTSP